MAKIKFGMMMTDARGKLGGQVFSKKMQIIQRFCIIKGIETKKSIFIPSA